MHEARKQEDPLTCWLLLLASDFLSLVGIGSGRYNG